MTSQLSLEQRIHMAFPGLAAAYSVDGLLHYRVEKSRIPELTQFLHEKARGRLALLFAGECRALSEKCAIQYRFAFASDLPWVLLAIELAGHDRLFTSITPSVHAAQW